MNRFVKGSIAVGVGIVLLLGGAGTFALWNGTASITDASVQSGSLTLTSTGGAWDTLPAKWVPGDSYTYTSTLALTAVGDNIKATLKVDPSTITSSGAGGTALKSALTIALSHGTVTGGSLTDNGDGTFDVTAAGTYSIPVTVTVTFPTGSSYDNTTQNGTVDLSDLGFEADQHL